MSSKSRTSAVEPAVVDIARTAVVQGQTSGESQGLGEHLATHEDSSGLMVVEFACTLPAYPGWRWTVVLAQGAGDEATVCDVVLLPGEGALVAPDWVPWRDRVLPGDLGPGDILPSDPHDARLMPGYEGTDEHEDVLEAVWELGLGRERVLTLHGREVTAERWHAGSTGPGSAEARLAPHPCVSCGFFISLNGALRSEFGVCANEFSPADGRVVNIGFGCGAHSAVVESVARETSATLDEFEFQPLDLRSIEADDDTTARQDRQGAEGDVGDRADGDEAESLADGDSLADVELHHLQELEPVREPEHQMEKESEHKSVPEQEHQPERARAAATNADESPSDVESQAGSFVSTHDDDDRGQASGDDSAL